MSPDIPPLSHNKLYHLELCSSTGMPSCTVLSLLYYTGMTFFGLFFIFWDRFLLLFIMGKVRLQMWDMIVHSIDLYMVEIKAENYYDHFMQWVQAEGFWRMVEHIIVAFVVISFLNYIRKLQLNPRGRKGIIGSVTKLVLRFSRRLAFVNDKIEKQLETEAAKNTQQLLKDKKVVCKFSELPKKGHSHTEILTTLDDRIRADIDPTAGKTFAYVYQHSKQHSKLTQECFMKYVHSNALNPVVFNSLRVIENEVVQMAISLFNGDSQCVGNVTSCGTESLLLTMKTYRDYRGYGDVIMSSAGHPGINKGCHYVGLNVVEIPVDQTKRMSIKHLKKCISSKTVLVVASAPQYPHGVVDNIEEIGKICQKYGVPLHIDSAIGGFVLPFIEKLGRNRFGKWDFRVPGVTSINADIHKYGYSPKGSSVLVYRNSKIRRHQYFTFSTWPGGIYISPTALGSRNGGCLSSAWGSFLDLGEQGFVQCTKKILDVVDKLCKFIDENPQLELVAIPDSSIVSFKCKKASSYKLADGMKIRGYAVEMQASPECLHMSIMPQHCPLVDDIIRVMKEALEEILDDPTLYEKDSKAVYGMLAEIPDEVVVEDFMVRYMDNIYKFRGK